MRLALMLALMPLAAFAATYEISGRTDPPSTVPVFLHGATTPFESSAVTDPQGRFRFRKLEAGAYTLAVMTQARGEVLQTVDLSPGTVDPKGRLEVVVRLDQSHLESDAARTPGATISARTLSLPPRAIREYREAQQCLARHDTENAAAHLQRAVEAAPDFAAAWNQLGTIAYQTGRYDAAETNFRRALDADPDAFEPLVNLGGVLLNLQRPEEALACNRRAVARRPNDALANSQLGLTWFQLNDLDNAARSLETAVRLDPAHFSHPQLTLAQIYARRGDRVSAAAQLRDFLKRHPDAPEASSVRESIARLENR
jgi:tetratricopeptide (TPR) repeat protein